MDNSANTSGVNGARPSDWAANPNKHPHSKHVVEQFAGMMKQKQSYVDKDHKDAVEEAHEGHETEDSSDLRTVYSTQERSKSKDDSTPSVPKAIHHIQKQLTRLSRIRGQEKRAKDLHEHAQSTVDKLKAQGYKVRDLKLPDQDSG